MQWFIQTFFQNFWLIVIFLFIFGGSITAFVRWMFNAGYEHQLKMQEKKNEELRLRLELARMQQKPGRGREMPEPKESTWDEQPVASYEGGYQSQESPERAAWSEAESDPEPVEKTSQFQEMPPQTQK
ncbi:hypothetical protein [Ktedonospora formicarum]|nr:hypothetical protein [Ktedonospora formicarum]